MITEETFNLILSLLQKQPWLANKTEHLNTLLTCDCSSDKEQLLILNLLNNFTYLTSNDYGDALDEIVKKIINTCTEKSTAVVAMAIGGGPDSSQHVIYQMKPSFEENGWRKPLLINNLDKLLREIKKKNQVESIAIDTIVIVDEFIGSGSTVQGRSQKIKREYLGNHDIFSPDCSIKFFSIASTFSGYEYIKNLNIDCTVQYKLKKGISDFGGDRIEKIKLMKSMEKILLPEFEGKELPSLGYGEVEALYGRDRGNVPNNVFPIFWWSMYQDNSDRKTLLTRLMSE